MTLVPPYSECWRRVRCWWYDICLICFHRLEIVFLLFVVTIGIFAVVIVCCGCNWIYMKILHWIIAHRFRMHYCIPSSSVSCSGAPVGWLTPYGDKSLAIFWTAFNWKWNQPIWIECDDNGQWQWPTQLSYSFSISRSSLSSSHGWSTSKQILLLIAGLNDGNSGIISILFCCRCFLVYYCVSLKTHFSAVEINMKNPQWQVHNVKSLFNLVLRCELCSSRLLWWNWVLNELSEIGWTSTYLQR